MSAERRNPYSTPQVYKGEETVISVRGRGRGYEPKWRHEFKDPDSGETKRSLIRRQIPSWLPNMRVGYEGLSDAELYYQKWCELRDAGLPVVPEVVVISSNEVLVTDMESLGERVFEPKEDYNYASALRRQNDGELEWWQEQVIETDWETVYDHMREFTNRASAAGIILPSDGAFQVLLTKDGSWDVLCLDIRLAIKAVNEPISEIEAINSNILDESIEVYRETVKSWREFASNH